MTEYVTIGGVVLDVGRVDRRLLDDLPLYYSRPTPPMRDVEIWDGSIEKVPETNDPEFLDALAEYYLEISQGQFELIETAVRVVGTKSAEIGADSDELELLGVVGLVHKSNELARITENSIDKASIMSLIFYNSTITQTGIDEAMEKFAVMWETMPVLSYKIKPGHPVSASQYFTDRQTAAHFGFKWNSFCQLWGWEQSEYAALFAAQNTLEHIITMEAKRK